MNKKVWIISSIFIFFSIFCLIKVHTDFPYMIATTKSLEKANQIQDFLTTETRPTGRCIVTDEQGNNPYYGITVDKHLTDNYRKIAAELLNSQIMDESIVISVNTKHTKNPYKLWERVQKELENIILNIDGVESAYINTRPDINSIKPDEKFEEIKVTIHTKDKVDYRKINKEIYLLIKPVVQDNSSAIISIYNGTLGNNAREEYKKKNYQKALEFLMILAEYNPTSYDDIATLRNFINVDNKIKKNPRNYKLYIERGDLENVPSLYFMLADEVSSFCYNPEGAIKDYNKALELNPNAYVVYEKRGDAWARVNRNPDELSIKELRFPSDDKHVIADYTKAIELTGGNDRLYSKLGNRFLYDNPDKALEAYSKIKVLSVDTQFNMANCYAKLGKYDRALEMTNDILKKATDENDFSKASNLKFFYNWKAGHYMTALKNADNCSKWYCNLAGVFF